MEDSVNSMEALSEARLRLRDQRPSKPVLEASAYPVNRIPPNRPYIFRLGYQSSGRPQVSDDSPLLFIAV
jgi:hypothetical protein